jgi:hypothetical protein
VVYRIRPYAHASLARNSIVTYCVKTNRLVAHRFSFWSLLILSLSQLTPVTAARASNLDTIGLTLLHSVTNLNGAGIRVGHAEAGTPTANNWEPNPSNVGLPASDFTFYDSGLTAIIFPNSLGLESGHADGVGNLFYGNPGGVCTNIGHVDAYDAAYFVNTLVVLQTAINDRIVNQSFIDGSGTNQQEMLDTDYDNYSAKYNMLFSSSVGDGGLVSAPATCYNGIGVAAYGTPASSVGPTPDNGRAKPDITAPADATSDSAPLVSGAVALLYQAGLRGDGGSDTNSAVDMRTVKALLLNGAVKPSDWTNAFPSPLDTRYGSGILNVFNSFEQLAGGKHGFIDSNSVASGSPHPPTSATGNVSKSSGWDLNTDTSSTSPALDGVRHYYFELTNGAPRAAFTGTATLAWNRQANHTTINELDLYLYNVATGNLVAVSSNAIDNVKHIFVTRLPPGRYDLQVVKTAANTVTASETYALAFEFFSMKLSVTQSGGNLVFSWPVYPAGFWLETAPTLNSTSWTESGVTPIVTNYHNVVTISAASGNQVFRLVRP